jgi:hypothetical protein
VQLEASGSWKVDERVVAVLIVVAESVEVVVFVVAAVVMLTVVVAAEKGYVMEVWTESSVVVEVDLVLQGLKVWRT